MQSAKKDIQLFVNNCFEPSSSGQTFSSINPATEEEIAEISLADAGDVERAVLAARAAFDEGPWPRMRGSERAEYLLAMADAIEENQEILGLLECMDTGLPLATTRAGHVVRGVQNFRYFAAEIERIGGEAIPLDNAYLHVTSREPIGVVAIITPWNAPLGLATSSLAAALACGNTCVIKPSELSPITTSELAKIVEALELPPGVVNVVHGPGRPTGEALASHPGVDAISFTGSSPTGRRLMELASRDLKRFVGELGGNAPTIIFADADLEQALDATLLTAFANNGEACVAGSRLLVERSLYPTFVERFVERVQGIVVGDPLAERTEVGPVISAAHRSRLSGLITEACDLGAKLRCGGAPPGELATGFYLQPTVVADVPLHARLSREEVMGPVVGISSFEDEADAVRRANDTIFGLAAYVWSGNSNRALGVAQQLRTGTVWVNASITRDIRVPFGGFKQSGVGRIGGRFSIDAFTEVKNTCIAVRPYPLRRFGAREPRKPPHV
ncbi:MAG TPA: aldehyde dehydrogenase family protein [Kofleriaceae bacterium]|nr:aldehyde dehydrogenase family protein [Kofleriaceae bacterium]